MAKSMSVWKFIWIVAWREASVVMRVIQAVSVTIPFLLTVSVGAFGGTWSRDLWPWWAWASLTFGLILLAMMIGVFRRAYSLEKALEPQFETSDPIEDHLPWNADGSLPARRRHWSIDITNVSNCKLTNCSVKEFRFVNRHGRVAPESGRIFRLRSERQAQKGQHTYQRTFHLRGMRDSVGVDICLTDETDPRQGILMTYATSPTGTIKDVIDKSLFPHWLTIRVTADEMPIPEAKTLKIFMSEDGLLKMETATDQPPIPNFSKSLPDETPTDSGPPPAITPSLGE